MLMELLYVQVLIFILAQDGITWLQINRSIVQVVEMTIQHFTGRSILARTGQGQCSLRCLKELDNDYGEVIIADGAKNLYSFRMEGTGALSTRTFFAQEITVTGTKV